jgi:hypothetical protein
MPEQLARIQFARDASAKLNIDSAVMRAELDQAARMRQDRIGGKIADDIANLPSSAPTNMAKKDLQEQLLEATTNRKSGFAIRSGRLSGVEKVLLRALAVDELEFEPSRRFASDAIRDQPSYFEHLLAYGALRALATRGTRDPMEAVEDSGQQALVAEALFQESYPPRDAEVRSAVQEVQEREIERRLRALHEPLAAASRAGDEAGLTALFKEKLELDRALQLLRGQDLPGDRKL